MFTRQQLFVLVPCSTVLCLISGISVWQYLRVRSQLNAVNRTENLLSQRTQQVSLLQDEQRAILSNRSQLQQSLTKTQQELAKTLQQNQLLQQQLKAMATQLKTAEVERAALVQQLANARQPIITSQPRPQAAPNPAPQTSNNLVQGAELRSDF